jgi:hypothetical protein
MISPWASPGPGPTIVLIPESPPVDHTSSLGNKLADVGGTEGRCGARTKLEELTTDGEKKGRFVCVSVSQDTAHKLSKPSENDPLFPQETIKYNDERLR